MHVWTEAKHKQMEKHFIFFPMILGRPNAGSHVFIFQEIEIQIT